MMRWFFALLLLLLPVSCVARPTRIEAVSSEALFLETLQAALRQELPTPLPVKVRFAPMAPHLLGLTRRFRGGLIVEVDDAQSFQGQVDTLIHEWAHAVLDGTHQEHPHDELWGVVYARCYIVARRVSSGEMRTRWLSR